MRHEWVLFTWFEEHGESAVHTEDLAEVRALSPYGKVFRLEKTHEGLAWIRYGDVVVRVRADMLDPVDATVVAIGERRHLADGRTVEIDEIRWHHQRQEPFYHVRTAGKRTTMRYWNADLHRGPIRDPKGVLAGDEQ